MPEKVRCLKCFNRMEEVLTRKGVLIDTCSHCKGVWLDQGELNFFTKDKKSIREYAIKGLEKIQETNSKCPKCNSKMQSGCIPSYSFQVEECLSCRGIFFDAHEFKKLNGSKNFQTISKDSSDLVNRSTLKHIPSSIPKVKTPSLFLTMCTVCVSLYGLLFAVFVFLMEIFNFSLLTGSLGFLVIILFQFYFSPIILDLQLKFFGSLYWIYLENLPPHFKKSLIKLCKENRLPLPKVGIIRDGSPQAYTYGRTPYSARLVFSEGIFELLDEEEVEAVLAHELGHIKHWDFVVMTVVKVVPLILYNLYRICKDSLSRLKNTSGKEKNSGAAPIAVAMVVAYIAYFIAEYLVLFVSRVREYYADRFSCFATKKPNKLLTALVKISYGLLASRPQKDTEKDSYESKVKTFESLNIMNISRSKQIALVHQGAKQGDTFNPESIKECMRWDLWNPWAFYYELHSTHPLTAKRINAISAYAISMKQKPYLLFNKEKPESYWDDFFVDIFFLLLPYILGFGSLIFWLFYNNHGLNLNLIEELTDSTIINLFLLFVFWFSLGAFIRVRKSYPGGDFLPYSTASLLKLIKISPVRSYPVTLNGYILGRGDAGNIFSEDMVLRDQTGMIFLNHEPFGFNVLFALFRYKKFQGKKVSITGWYRRSPAPYVEVNKVTTSDTSTRAYTYHYKIAFCIIGMAAPFLYRFFIQ